MNKIEIVTSVGFFISYVETMHGTKSLKYMVAVLFHLLLTVYTCTAPAEKGKAIPVET
jgi:hypothetical protein